jgi:hypothetical protein
MPGAYDERTRQNAQRNHPVPISYLCGDTQLGESRAPNTPPVFAVGSPFPISCGQVSRWLSGAVSQKRKTAANAVPS